MNNPSPPLTADQERFLRAEHLFHEALARPYSERESWLRAQCAGDATVEAATKRLLTGHHAASKCAEFMEPPGDGHGLPADDEAELLSGWVGRAVGQYTIRRLIGVGGMGAVFEAHSRAPARSVALKIMRAGLLAGSGIKRFEREARALARLRHPGIAHVIEAGTQESAGAGVTPWIALELVPGAQPLTVFARQHGLTQRGRIELFLRVCDAVHHGHLNGVIHRDLKPANILVADEPGHAAIEALPKVIDFGVARLATSDDTGASRHTAAGPLLGTLTYMSPEQCAGVDHAPTDLAAPDARCDVYSLGAVLYELLVGQPPLRLDGLPLIQALAHVQTATIALPTGNAALDSDLGTIILKALARNPAERYQSVTEFAADLRRYLANEPITARAPTLLHQLRLMARRNRPAFVAAAVVACVLVGSTVVSAAFSVAATREAARAETALKLARSERDRALRVAAFLKGVLGSADPQLPMTITPELQQSSIAPLADWRFEAWPYSGRPGRRATVTDLLIAAGRRLPETFADDDPARAELGDTIGNSLFNLGAHESVISPMLKDAVAAAQRAFGDDHASTILARCHLAHFLGRYEEGSQRPVYQSALDASERLYGPSDPRTLEIVRFLAATMVAWRFEYRPAGELCMSWVQRATDAGADHGGVWILRAYAAFCFGLASDHEKAEQLARRAVADAERHGGDPVTLAETRNMLGQTLALEGKHAESVTQFEAAVPVFESAMGRSCHQTMHLLSSLALSYRATGDFDAALATSRRVVHIASQLEGDSSYNAITFRQDLAVWLMNQDREPQERQALAERMNAGQLAFLEEEQPGRVPSLATAAARTWISRLIAAEAMMAQQATAHLGEERLQAMIAELDQTATDAVDADEHPPKAAPAVARYRLAGRLIKAGRLDEAEALLDASRQILSSLKGVAQYEVRRGIIEAELRAKRNP